MAPVAVKEREPASRPPDQLDHFIEVEGKRCAGKHLLIDLYGAKNIGAADIKHIESTMRECIEAAGATLLHIHLHPFEGTGASGVAVLAESHISIHTWPENGYAALDVFMCGEAKPEACIPIFRKAFKPKKIAVSELLRGQGA